LATALAAWEGAESRRSKWHRLQSVTLASMSCESQTKIYATRFTAASQETWAPFIFSSYCDGQEKLK